MADEWRPVPTHEGYWANENGEILGPGGSILKPMRQPKSGHLYVLTPRPRSPRKLFVHRAVLLAFIGPPAPGEEACHGDDDPSNNALANLRWDTRLANVHDKARNGRIPCGESKPGARLTTADVLAIRRDARPSRAVGRDYGVSHTAVLRIRRGERWRAA